MLNGYLHAQKLRYFHILCNVWKAWFKLRYGAVIVLFWNDRHKQHSSKNTFKQGIIHFFTRQGTKSLEIWRILNGKKIIRKPQKIKEQSLEGELAVYGGNFVFFFFFAEKRWRTTRISRWTQENSHHNNSLKEMVLTQ